MLDNYIYDIFTITEDIAASDLNVGFAKLQESQPIPEGYTDQDIREFIGRHYAALVEAYKAHDREAFAAAVARCEDEDGVEEE